MVKQRPPGSPLPPPPPPLPHHPNSNADANTSHLHSHSHSHSHSALVAATLLGVLACIAHDCNPLQVSVLASLLAALLTWRLVPAVAAMFLRAGIKGCDVHKPLRPTVYASSPYSLLQYTYSMPMPLPPAQRASARSPASSTSSSCSYSSQFPFCRTLSSTLPVRRVVFLHSPLTRYPLCHLTPAALSL